MGVITIEVPQKVKKTLKIVSEKKAKDLIESLESGAKPSKKVDLSSVAGMWSYRKESEEEIARDLRSKSNSRDKNG